VSNQVWRLASRWGVAAVIAVGVCLAVLLGGYAVVIGLPSIAKPNRPPDPMLHPPVATCSSQGCRPARPSPPSGWAARVTPRR
jgi:hypothetical protein